MHLLTSETFGLHRIDIRSAPLHFGVRAGLPVHDTFPYNKPYLSVEEQVELLRARGMGISDTDRAEACLHRIGYYRLSGYAYPFRHRDVITHMDGTTEERVFEVIQAGDLIVGRNGSICL